MTTVSSVPVRTVRGVSRPDRLVVFVFTGAVPYWIALIAVIVCLAVFPEIATYLPNPKGPVFMTLIEKTFGKAVTTRTWETVTKVAR